MTNDKQYGDKSESPTPDKEGSSDSNSTDLPEVERKLADQPGDAGSPHKGQSGSAGSGKDADLQSVGQSQSDRASGTSS